MSIWIGWWIWINIHIACERLFRFAQKGSISCAFCAKWSTVWYKLGGRRYFESTKLYSVRYSKLSSNNNSQNHNQMRSLSWSFLVLIWLSLPTTVQERTSGLIIQKTQQPRAKQWMVDHQHWIGWFLTIKIMISQFR